MIFYQDAEGEWYATQADAKKNSTSFKQVDVPTDKYGLRDWLINYRATLISEPTTKCPNCERSIPHGAPHCSCGVDPIRKTPPPSVQSAMTEDEFELLPLPMQLHLACLALENARTRIKP